MFYYFYVLIGMQDAKITWSRPGSNWGPSACEADVITATPRDLTRQLVLIYCTIHILLDVALHPAAVQTTCSFCNLPEYVNATNCIIILTNIALERA